MLTKEQFVLRANLKHNNKYNYDKVLYKNNKSKVCIICPEHGEFWQRVDSHLYGTGCPNCGRSKKLTTTQFIERSKNIHGDVYDYSKVEYYNFKSPITIGCPIHGDFIQIAGNHLAGNGCYKCRDAKISKNVMLTNNEFIQKAKLVHGDLYDYSKTNYTGSDSDVMIICKKHGEFLQNAHVHLRGHGCQKCCSSKGERLISEFLSEHQLNFIPQFCINDIKFQKYMKIDFMIMFEDKQYFIEYNGIQHYYPVKQFGGENALNRVKNRDKMLTDYCKENDINLLVFRYNQTKEEIINKLNDIFVLHKHFERN